MSEDIEVEIIDVDETDIAIMVYRIINETDYCWTIQELKQVFHENSVLASETMIRKVVRFLQKEYLVHEAIKNNEETGKPRVCYTGIPNPPKLTEQFISYLRSKTI